MSGEQESEFWEAPLGSPVILGESVGGEVNFIQPAFKMYPWRAESGNLITELGPSQIFGVTKHAFSLDLWSSSIKI